MLPSKSITPFLGIRYGQAHPTQFSVLRKITTNEEKGSPSICETPFISQFSKELPYDLLRVSSLVKALLDSSSK